MAWADVFGFFLATSLASNFTSLLELLYAMNLAFGLWRGFVLSFVEQYRIAVQRKLSDSAEDGGRGERTIGIDTTDAYFDVNEKYIDRVIFNGQVAASLMAILILILLGMIEFSPMFKLPAYSVILLGLFLLAAPAGTYLRAHFVMRQWGRDMIAIQDRTSQAKSARTHP